MGDRPVECSHCKKPIKTCYKEVIGEAIFPLEMCEDCPIFQQKLHGKMIQAQENRSEGSSGLCCGSCLTTLESVKTGNPLGCSNCYTVFADLLTKELVSAHRVPHKLAQEITLKKSISLHMGKSPAKLSSITPSSQLTALNEALNEALKRENYEQAAWLRDQIKDLMGKINAGKKPTP